jgi:hypothetical protein
VDAITSFQEKVLDQNVSVTMLDSIADDPQAAPREKKVGLDRKNEPVG